MNLPARFRCWLKELTMLSTFFSTEKNIRILSLPLLRWIREQQRVKRRALRLPEGVQSIRQAWTPKGASLYYNGKTGKILTAIAVFRVETKSVRLFIMHGGKEGCRE